MKNILKLTLALAALTAADSLFAQTSTTKGSQNSTVSPSSTTPTKGGNSGGTTGTGTLSPSGSSGTGTTGTKGTTSPSGVSNKMAIGDQGTVEEKNIKVNNQNVAPKENAGTTITPKK